MIWEIKKNRDNQTKLKGNYFKILKNLTKKTKKTKTKETRSPTFTK